MMFRALIQQALDYKSFSWAWSSKAFSQALDLKVQCDIQSFIRVFEKKLRASKASSELWNVFVMIYLSKFMKSYAVLQYASIKILSWHLLQMLSPLLFAKLN